MKPANPWLEDILEYRFADQGLLEVALTHRSSGGQHNERLEFLGDSVLNCVIAEALYRALPEAREGVLSRLRAALVKRATLAEIAVEIELGERLRMGTGELKSGGFRRESILADAVEALIGALYLDGGFDTARRAIHRLYARRLEQLPGVAELRDAKTRLQEYLQARRLPLPTYSIEAAEGEAHDRTFTVTCQVQGLQLRAQGIGKSRRQAEQEAAVRVLEQLPDA